jgi:hypothetical protein
MTISERRIEHVSGPVLSARAVSINVSEDSLSVRLVDGRTISVPLAWFPRLLGGTDQQRSNWRIFGDGIGIHWPELDEHISVENLLATRSEDILTYRDTPEAVVVEPSESTPTQHRPRGRVRQAEELIARNARGQFIKTGRFKPTSALDDMISSAVDSSSS